MNTFVIFFWYAFGWMGTILLLMTLLLCVTDIYKTLHLEKEKNVNTKWKKTVAQLYRCFDFDQTKDNIMDLRIPFPATCVMAVIAMFGTYTIPVTLVLLIVTFITLQIWHLQNK